MFEGLSKGSLLKEAKKALDEAISADSGFTREAKIDFSYRDGWGQWTDEQKRLLNKDKRSALTMNILRSTVELIMGMYEDSRVRHYPSPIEPNDSRQCEVLDKLANIIFDRHDVFGIQESAQQSATICGRGWTYVDFYNDPKRPGFIEFDVGSAPALEVKVDPASRKPDKSDASYICWPKWVRVEDFKVRYPEFASHIDNVIGEGKMVKPFLEEPGKGSTGIYELNPEGRDRLDDYSEPLDINYYDKGKRQVKVVHMEYWCNYYRYFAWLPDKQEYVEFNKEDIKNYEKLFDAMFGIEFTYEKMQDKKIKWLQFIGDKIIFSDDSPISYDGFSLIPCIAFSDSSSKTSMDYGVIRPLKDPQDELNKRWSQYINLMNKQVQPGVWAEENAFLDNKQAEASMSTPGDTTFLQEGGLLKIKERDVPQLPVAALQLMDHSKEITRWISGLNENLFGFSGETYQSSVVFQLRQSQGVTILRPLFRNFKKSDEEVYKRIIAIVASSMQPAQIVEMLGDSFDYNGVDITNLENVKYNVAFEEMPGSRTRKAIENAAYIEMLQYGFPVDPNVVVGNLAIGEDKKRQWLEYIQQQQQSQAEQADKAYQLEVMKIQAKMKVDTDKLGVDTAVDSEKLKQSDVKAIKRHEIEKERLATQRRGQELDFLARTAQTEAAKSAKRVGSPKSLHG